MDCCNLSPSRFARDCSRSMRDCDSARQLLDQARDRRGELTATAAKIQSDVQYMAETCLNELGIQRHELVADTTIEIVYRRAACCRRPGLSRHAHAPRRHGSGQHDGAGRVQGNRGAARLP